MVFLRGASTILLACLLTCVVTLATGAQQTAPAASGARILLLPRRIVSGERATLAVKVSCVKRQAAAFSITYVGLDLEADASHLKPGEHRTLTVRVRGTAAKVTMEARNLATDIAELTGGNPVRSVSSGGVENLAKFEVTGIKNGNFLISIRLASLSGRPAPRERAGRSALGSNSPTPVFCASVAFKGFSIDVAWP